MKKIIALSLALIVFVNLTSFGASAQVALRPGRLNTQVEASVGQFYLDVSGYISPFASLVLTSDGVFFKAVTADAQGNFAFGQILINQGFSGFCIDAVDFKRIGESYTCFKIPPATASVTMKDIFLPPTLGLSRTQINEGGSAIAFGYTMPGARVTLHLNGEQLSIVADQTGYYQFILQNVKAGNYNLYATATLNDKNSLKPSKVLVLAAISKPSQAINTVANWWDQLLRFLKNWLWNPLWLIIPILILIIILIWKLWGRRFLVKNPFKRRPLHHSWWMGY